MNDIEYTIDAGKSKRLLTKGKLCDKNIVVTAATDRYDEGYEKGYSAGSTNGFHNGYSDGYNNGQAEGIEQGVEQGKQAEYDAFWDAYQENGNKTDYAHGFAGFGWNDTTFKPKYDIKPVKAYHLFSNTGITDLVKLLNDRNVKLDLSRSTDAQYLAQGNVRLTTMPTLDLRSRPNINYLLNNCPYLYSIEKVILKSDGSQKFNAYSFSELPLLEEIRFEGTIGSNLEIKRSPLLSTASVQSIIDCLKDLTVATQQTLTLHADVGNNMTAEQKAAITAKNWQLVY